MRRLMLLILALATLLPSLAQAYELLVLQSRRDPAFEEVLTGFRQENSLSQRVIVLSDYAEVDVTRIMREDRPKLVLALGDAAMTAARTIQQTPVIAVMSLAIHNQKKIAPNVSGIGMLAPPEKYMSLFASLKVRRVGVLYSASKTGWYLQSARQAAKTAGIELVTRELTSPRDVPAQLASLGGTVDALWMLPDTTVVTKETAEAWFRFGQEQNIPLVSFAATYLRLGAAAVLDVDRVELGRQAGEMSAAILGSKHNGTTHHIYPAKAPVKTNASVLKRLGLKLSM